MFKLSSKDIYLANASMAKLDAIKLVANALHQGAYVEPNYVQGMLDREQQTSTYLGNGIAIPHGTLATRDQVKQTGAVVFQFPDGIEWGEGNITYVVIGIAAKSDEHLTLLRQLTHVLSDDEVAHQLATVSDKQQFQALLMDESNKAICSESLISMAIDTDSMLTLKATNAAKLEIYKAIEQHFIQQVVINEPLYLGDGVWLNDSAVGNLANAIAISAPKEPFQYKGYPVHSLITCVSIDESLHPLIQPLLTSDFRKKFVQLHSVTEIIETLNPQQSSQQSPPMVSEQALSEIFTIRNEHGLHARPTALLVQVAKKFSATISVENLDRKNAPVNAKSMMKVVSLGVLKGHRLKFVAEGDDAKEALAAIGEAIQAGLGE